MKNSLRPKIRIDSIYIDNVNLAATLERIQKTLQEPGRLARRIVTVNAQFVDIARKQPEFAAALAEADIAVADGMSIVLAARLLGSPLQGRIAGVDLMVHITEIAASMGKSIYLLGGRPGAAEQTGRNLVSIYPGLRISGVDCPPWGFERDPIQSKRVIEAIQRSAPDVLFVALGAPKQELWITQYLKALPVSIVMGVGGSFEMLSGQVRRAPHWLQTSGFEWLYRLSREPRRLWRRYLFGNFRFMSLVVKQCLGKQMQLQTYEDPSHTREVTRIRRRGESA